MGRCAVCGARSVRQFTAPRGGGGGAVRDGSDWSLGLTQYQWLAQTLEKSQAKFKFVFIHNLLCGDQASRGGVEVASFNEWGGKNLDGTEGFKAHRPGWDMPVHQLLVKNHVAAVIKAHDNFFARQELDGIVYQMIPQPSFAGDDRIRDLENYGYKQGTFQGNSGHVRVTVSPEKVRVEYRFAPNLPKDATRHIPTARFLALTNHRTRTILSACADGSVHGAIDNVKVRPRPFVLARSS